MLLLYKYSNRINNSNGYIYHTLKNTENIRITNSTHRLIAQTWIINTENKPTVDHINRIKDDNKVSNLRWATYKEQNKNSNLKDRKLTERKVWKCDSITGEKLMLYDSVKKAAIAVTKSINASKNISSCALGNHGLLTAYGFKWEYDKIIEIINEEWILYKTGPKSIYYVSNFGRIKNKDRLLTPTNDKGYKIVIMNNKGYFVHRLVAKLFIKNNNPEFAIKVNHKDGDRSNNNINNLEWTTISENNIHAINTGLVSSVKKVIIFNKEGKIENIYNSCSEAARKNNLNNSSVNYYCKHNKGHEDILFKYLEPEDDILNMIVGNIPIKKEPKIIRNLLPIAVYDKQNNLLEICTSMKDASIKYNVTMRTVEEHALGKIKVPRNPFIFKFYEEIN